MYELREDDKQAGEDGKWWKEIGNLVGLNLYGWTFKHRATFIDTDGRRDTVEMPGWFAPRIAAAVEAERKACEEILTGLFMNHYGNDLLRPVLRGARDAIAARGKEKK